jgi:hypothetical protein
VPPCGRVCGGDERAGVTRTSADRELAVRRASRRSSSTHVAGQTARTQRHGGADEAKVEDTPEPERELDPKIAAALAQPSVVDWARLHGITSATTVKRQDGKRLLTDGPFLDSKEYIGGLVIVDAADLDGALAIADELQNLRPNVVIEVRPVLETA